MVTVQNPTTETDAPMDIAAMKKAVSATAASASVRRSKSRSTTASTASEASSMATSTASSTASSFRMEGEEMPTEQFFLWGCELSRSSDTHVLNFPEDADEDVEFHRLTLKTATLGINAIPKERNVVEIRCLDREGKEQRLTVASLTLGAIDTCKLDLTMTWTRGRDVTLKLLKGSGPVTIVGNHVIETEEPRDTEFVPPATDESSAEDTDGGTETEGDEMDDNEVEDIVKDAAEVGKPSGKPSRKT